MSATGCANQRAAVSNGFSCGLGEYDRGLFGSKGLPHSGHLCSLRWLRLYQHVLQYIKDWLSAAILKDTTQRGNHCSTAEGLSECRKLSSGVKRRRMPTKKPADIRRALSSFVLIGRFLPNTSSHGGDHARTDQQQRCRLWNYRDTGDRRAAVDFANFSGCAGCQVDR